MSNKAEPPFTTMPIVALDDQAAREEAIELIRSLIDAVILTPRQKQLQVEIRGELAAILATGEGRKKPGLSDRDSAEQIKVVAGTRVSWV